MGQKLDHMAMAENVLEFFHSKYTTMTDTHLGTKKGKRNFAVTCFRGSPF